MTPRKSARTGRRGFTMIELSITMLVFWMIILLFGAIFPVAIRGSNAGSSYAQAAQVAQHKIDQCRQQGYSNIYSSTGSVMTHLNLVGIVDSTPAPVQNPSGFPANSVSYSFTNIDNLGSGAPLPGSTGTLTIGPPAGTLAGTASVAMVTVTLAWPKTSTQAAGTFTTHTLIVNS